MADNGQREVDLDEGTGPDGRMTMAEARAATTKPPIQRDRAYVLMPAWLAERLPTVGEIGEEDDPMIFARWFSAAQTHWSWYVLAYDRATNIAYVLVTAPDIPQGEYGDVDVAELEAQRTPLRLPAVERDFLFRPCTVSQMRQEAPTDVSWRSRGELSFGDQAAVREADERDAAEAEGRSVDNE